MNSGIFCGAGFAFGPRDPSQESHATAGYNININFGPVPVARRQHLRGILRRSGHQQFESLEVASLGRS
jgi:hypothetical protein